MTYCCGLLVKDRLAMIADTRTNSAWPDAPFVRDLGEHWSVTLRAAVANMPAPPYKACT